MLSTSDWFYLSAAAAVVAFAIGLLLWALFWDRARGRKRCPKCWYSMHAASRRSPSGGESKALYQCPECGRQIVREKDLFRTRRRWKVAAASVGVFMFSWFIAVQPKAQRFGYASVTPPTVLLFVLHFDGPEWALEGLENQAYYDLLGHTRLGDYQDLWDRRTGRGMRRWQWRWLGDTLLSRLEEEADENRRLTLWRRYREMLMLSRQFAGDQRLRNDITAMLAQDLAHEDPLRRSHSLVALMDDADVQGALAALSAYLDDEHEDVRRTAVHAIRVLALRDERGVAALLDLLTHERPDVRAGALEGLAILGQRRQSTPAILGAAKAMKDDPDCDVRTAAIASVAQMLATDEAWQMIEAYMLDESDICLRRGGFRAVGAIRVWHWGKPPPIPEWIVPFAVKGLGDEDEAISWSSMWLIGDIAHDPRLRGALKEHVDVIEPYARHENPWFQRGINDALEQIRGQ